MMPATLKDILNMMPAPESQGQNAWHASNTYGMKRPTVVTACKG